MSKIEDALKKAKANNKSKTTATNSLTLLRGAKPEKQLLCENSTNKNTDETIKYSSNSKEIALMEEGELFDSNKLSQLKIISSNMSESRAANTYRELRTKLLHKSEGKNFIVMITSCVDDDSSASVTVNMASAFTFEETKTSLIIDCNLSKPRLHQDLQMEVGPGLIDYLEDESIDAESILYKTGIKRLRMIPAGRASESASEYFTSQRMHSLISDLLIRYSDRFIFINTPPITESADSKILVELCDFTILVVPYATTSKAKVEEAADKLGKDKLLGVIFNDIPKTPRLGFLGV